MRQWQSVKIKCLRVCGWDWRLGWLLGCWPGGIRFLLRWNDNSLKGYYFLNPNPNLSRSCIDDRPNDQPPSLHLIQLHESNVISILFCLIFYWTNNDRVEFDNIMIALHVSPIPTLLPSALLWITAAFSALCSDPPATSYPPCPSLHADNPHTFTTVMSRELNAQHNSIEVEVQ